MHIPKNLGNVQEYLPNMCDFSKSNYDYIFTLSHIWLFISKKIIYYTITLLSPFILRGGRSYKILNVDQIGKFQFKTVMASKKIFCNNFEKIWCSPPPEMKRFICNIWIMILTHERKSFTNFMNVLYWYICLFYFKLDCLWIK